MNIAEDTEIPIEIIGNSIQPSVVEVGDYNDYCDENEIIGNSIQPSVMEVGDYNDYCDENEIIGNSIQPSVMEVGDYNDYCDENEIIGNSIQPSVMEVGDYNDYCDENEIIGNSIQPSVVEVGDYNDYCDENEIIGNSIQPSVMEVGDYNDYCDENEIIGNSIQPFVAEVSDYNDYCDENENGRLRNSLMAIYHRLKLRSCSGLNSMMNENVSELELTNIINLSIISGPPSDYSAIYTALVVAHGISVLTESKSSMTIISLDLDLYKNIYLLVNSRDDLRNSFLLCLGELHTVFAYVRAVGTFIECSDSDNARIKSN